MNRNDSTEQNHLWIHAPNWYIHTCIERMRCKCTYQYKLINTDIIQISYRYTDIIQISYRYTDIIQISYTLKGKIPVGHSVVHQVARAPGSNDCWGEGRL